MTKRPSGRKKPPSDQTYPKVAATFGTNLAKARERSGISQNQLASASGKARSYISAVESGRWNLTLATAETLALHVGQTLPDLLNPSWSGPDMESVRVGDVTAIMPDTISIEMPPGAAFEIARIAAPKLHRDIPLIDPKTRRVVAVVSKEEAD